MRSRREADDVGQIASASSSLTWTVTQMRSPSRPSTSVTNSHAHGMASVLEVVAEAEVAEHLEEAEVARRRPISSRSLCLPPARTHFCTDVRPAVDGGGSSPRKYGTNGIIPELVNIGRRRVVRDQAGRRHRRCGRARRRTSSRRGGARSAFMVRDQPTGGGSRSPGRRMSSSRRVSSASRSRMASRPSATAARRSLRRARGRAPAEVGRRPARAVALDRLPRRTA